MAGRNGPYTEDSDLSDIELRSPADNDAGQTTATKGPWTHSTNSYSRSVLQDTEPKTSKRVHCIAVIACAVVFIVGICLGIVIGVFAVKSRGSDDNPDVSSSPEAMFVKTTRLTTTTTTTTTTTPEPCVCFTQSTAAPTIKPECSACASRNPDESSGNEHLTSSFAALSQDEISKAMSVMVNYGNASYGRSLYDNRISHVYLYPSNKSDVVAYLDRGGQFPGRFAKVHVFRGSREPPDVMEYRVGPLDQSEDQINIEQLRQDGEINFNRRPYDMTESQILYQAVDPYLKAIQKLLNESFDGKYYRRGIGVVFAYAQGYNDSTRVSTAYLHLQMGGFKSIRIIPVTFRVYHPGTDQNKWRVTDFYYLSQGPYESAQALQDAYDNGDIRKIIYPSGYFTSRMHEFDLILNTSLPERPLSDLPPPDTYEPQGPRYTIKGSRISWMGWELDYTSDPIRGPAIYDVRFQGNRIAYEISLQDVTLLYASQSSGAGPAAITDTVFYLGNSNPPRPGLDCPKRASLVDLSLFAYGQARLKPSACVFEADGQDSIWKFQSLGISSHFLVIRSTMNLGNYEYSVEWRLHLDGHLETLITASGFLYGAFWDKDDPLVDADKSSTPFGFRIAEYALGPIHDHSYAFKVDVDILGEENSFEVLHWKAGDVLSALNTQTNTSEVPGYFPFNNTRYIQYELLDNESGFVLNPVKPKYFTVVNENEKNLWGVKRGYRIVPHSQGAENFDDHVMFGPWGHMKHNFAVTRRKDSEPYATNSLYDIFQPLESFQGISAMLDNETVRNEDLVVWVTEKFYHAPSAEDIPMTLKVQRGFTLRPYNYFDRTSTFDIRGYYADTPGDPYTKQSCYIP